MRSRRFLRLLGSLVGLILLLTLLIGGVTSPVGAGTIWPLSRPQDYRLELTATFSNVGDELARRVEIRWPLLSWRDSPYQVVVWRQVDPAPLRVELDERGDQYAVFSLDSLPAGASLTIKQTYLIKNFGLSSPLGTAAPPGALFPGPDIVAAKPGPKDLEPERLVESDQPAIVEKSRALTAAAQDNVEAARRIYAFVNSYLTYDPNVSNLGALTALRTGRGVCLEYASLFVALARAARIPARVVTGYLLPRELVVPPQGLNLSDRRHAWAEFFRPGLGWVPVEPTVDYRVNGIKTVPYQYFGGLPEGGHLVFDYSADRRTSWSYWGGRVSMTTTETLYPVQGLPSFVDTYGHWAKDSIEGLVQKGLMRGYPDGSFHPDRPVTRAEFLVALSRALGINPLDSGSGFGDTAGHWAEPYIVAARAFGLTAGYPDGTFRPDDPVRRAELAVFLRRALHLNPPPELEVFPDVPADHWAASSIAALKAAGLIAGYSDGTFHLEDQATRAQLAVILERVLTLAQRR